MLLAGDGVAHLGYAPLVAVGGVACFSALPGKGTDVQTVVEPV